jgi:hypothetical protein
MHSLPSDVVVRIVLVHAHSLSIAAGVSGTEEEVIHDVLLNCCRGWTYFNSPTGTRSVDRPSKSISALAHMDIKVE